MAIITKYPSPEIIKRLKYKVSALIKNGSIPLPENKNYDLTIAAFIEIQQIKTYNSPEIKSSLPEGYRIILCSGDTVVTTLDYYYKGKKLYFSHAYYGFALEDFISALNIITEKYAAKVNNQRISCIEFPHAGQPYFAIINKSRITLYTYSDDILHKITRKQLMTKLSKLNLSIKPFTQKPTP